MKQFITKEILNFKAKLPFFKNTIPMLTSDPCLFDPQY